MQAATPRSDVAPAVAPELVDRYTRAGFWGVESLADVIERHAAENPYGIAFIEGTSTMTWREYDERSTQIGAALVRNGFRPGERIAVQLPDAPAVHAVYVGVEKAGMTVIGIGLRAGRKEVRHLIDKAGAVGLISEADVRGTDMAALYEELRSDGLPLRAHLLLPELEEQAPASDAELQLLRARRLGPNDVYLLNSTSGTTGLPKIVTQFQNRWVAFHHLAAAAGDLTRDDVFMSLVPAPYGFGQWTATFTPTLLGAPCVLQSRFDAATVLEQIERLRVTVLACVSTQFVMLLNSPEIENRDLSSLRCMFTGGEAVPYDRAVEFEHQTGATVLQFFGSNETGALSHTTLRMDPETRLRTAGDVIPWMEVRLYDDEGRDITESGGPGQPAGKGPLTSPGYYDDADANAELMTPDGWMLMGDVCVLEGQTLRVVGRKSDFIIRGGKNISAAAVEEEVGTHAAVALAAAVAMDDAVYGERVACYVVLKPGAMLELEDLQAHLRTRGASIETWPERLVLVDSLPMSSGGKVAKGLLKEDMKRRLDAEGTVAR